MSLEAIAQMLGHRSMRMTLVYARIADRTVADEGSAPRRGVVLRLILGVSRRC
jgi:integrase